MLLNMFVRTCLRCFRTFVNEWKMGIDMCLIHYFHLFYIRFGLSVGLHVRQVLNVYWPLTMFVRPKVTFCGWQVVKIQYQWPCRIYRAQDETVQNIKHGWRGKGEDVWGWLLYGTWCLLAFFIYNPDGSPSNRWEGSVCNRFPTPVHTVTHTSAVLSPHWQLHSDFGNFNSGVCHVLKMTTAESAPDMGHNKFAALSPTFWPEPMTMSAASPLIGTSSVLSPPVS